MRTIKINLSFAKETGVEERHFNLFEWARTLVDNAIVRILDEKHNEESSYMVIENTYDLSK